MGMQPGEVILIGARPAMRKTSFARGVKKHLTAQGKRVYYFDFIFDGKDVHRDFAEFESELRASNADLAVFDHFQFLSDYDETDETAERLFKKIKSLASELQIPIINQISLQSEDDGEEACDTSIRRAKRKPVIFSPISIWSGILRMPSCGC